LGIFAQISLNFARRNTHRLTEFIEKLFLRGIVKANAVIMNELFEIDIVISHILDDLIKILDDGIKNLDLFFKILGMIGELVEDGAGIVHYSVPFYDENFWKNFFRRIFFDGARPATPSGGVLRSQMAPHPSETRCIAPRERN